MPRIFTLACSRSCLLAGAALSALAAGQPVIAQNVTGAQEIIQEADGPPAPEKEAIIVTGSRIQRRSVDKLEPTIIIGSDLIEKRGFGNRYHKLGVTANF